MKLIKIWVLLILFLSANTWAQSPTGSSTPAGSSDEPAGERPNGKRIRRQLSLILGVDHDEEFLIPNRDITVRGRTEFFDIKRISGTDYFRISPKKSGNGITTLNDKKTGQVLVEIRFDIRDDSIEKTLREVQSMLGDIEGIEYKVVNNIIHLDGYVLIVRDLIRIAQVIKTWGPERVKSLVTLSPLAKKKIVEYISQEINNPEVKVTSVGDFIKLEGQVNNQAEKDRIKNIVGLFLPDLVIDQAPDTDMLKIIGRKNGGKVEDLIVDLITVKKDEEKVVPPPKMIQIVAHFVKFADTYSKAFSFTFAPIISAQNGAANQAPTSSIQDTTTLLNNLLPKLTWAKFHGFAKVLDTASILIQDGKNGTIFRSVQSTALVPAPQGGVIITPVPAAEVTLDVTPTLKSERSGLIELTGGAGKLKVEVKTPGKSDSTTTTVTTIISVRDRQSAAFGGIIKKDTDTKYGSPVNPNALITLEASKEYTRNNSQFVVFVTPIIKSSASAGVEQVKKKFRLRD